MKNTFFFRNKLWISKSNELTLRIIKKIHDQFAFDHLEFRRTLQTMNRHFYWTRMRDALEQYIHNCHNCKKAKASRDKYSELLKSLSISTKSWIDLSMNFVIELSMSDEKDVILMIMNRMTKMRHYISCLAQEKEIFAEETAKLLIANVWKLHELSKTIVSDRESQFVSFVWRALCEILRIKTKLFIAFHFEIDEQSEITNQKMKRYLRNYCHYQQDDWTKWLSMTEFVFNVAIFAFTELFSFRVNYEFESRMNFNSIDSDDIARERVVKRKAIDIIEHMKNV
jgi:hypothetical protein